MPFHPLSANIFFFFISHTKAISQRRLWKLNVNRVWRTCVWHSFTNRNTMWKLITCFFLWFLLSQVEFFRVPLSIKWNKANKYIVVLFSIFGLTINSGKVVALVRLAFYQYNCIHKGNVLWSPQATHVCRITFFHWP